MDNHIVLEHKADTANIIFQPVAEKSQAKEQKQKRKWVARQAPEEEGELTTG